MATIVARPEATEEQLVPSPMSKIVSASKLVGSCSPYCNQKVNDTDMEGLNHAASDLTKSPPPLKFIDIDPNERMTRPQLPCTSIISSSSSESEEIYYPEDDTELIKHAEEMVHWAISSKHEFSLINPLASNLHPNSETEAASLRSNQQYAAEQHKVFCNLLNCKSNTSLLHKSLHALITSNNGRELDRLVTNSKLHAQIIHLIMQFNPFCPPTREEVEIIEGKGRNKKSKLLNVGVEKLRELDKVRRERKKRNVLLAKVSAAKAASSSQSQESSQESSSQELSQQSQSSLQSSQSSSTKSNRKSLNKVQIAEPSIRHKENVKYITPSIPYLSYSIADAYLHLIVSLISNNALLSVSAIRNIWNLLIDFGARWKDWSLDNVEREREVRRRRNNIRGRLVKKKFKVDNDNRRTSLQSNHFTESPKVVQPQATTAGGEEEQHPEGERPVPGMAGLSVEFVRGAFTFSRHGNDYEYGDDYGDNVNDVSTAELAIEEEIYSDRLASGRVRRLLLALINIFRLCPRSKLDLQNEISSNFPYYKTCPPALYGWYTHMCLQIVHLVPTFEGPILTLLVDKALDMDVEIKVNDKGGVVLDNTPLRDDDDEGVGELGHADDTIDGVKQDLFKDQADQTPSSKKRSFQQISQDSLAMNTPSKSNTNESLHMESDQIIEISEKLDSLMLILYQRIIEVTSFVPGSLSSSITAVINARRLYRHLDGVFDKKVRTTDRAKFVQFIFLVLFGRENDALEEVGRLMAKREEEQLRQVQQQQDASQTAGRSRSRSNSKDIVQTMKDIEMEPTMIPSAPINVTDPLYRSFSAKLIDLFYNPCYAGDAPRQTTVCYLASFVSRATYVCPETVCEVVAAILRWAEAYIAAQAKSGANGGGKSTTPRNVRRVSSNMSLGSQQTCEQHALFYTACQAAFYIMCFRGAEARQYYQNAYRHRDDPDSIYAELENVDIGAGRWKFLCGHAIQPLKYCLESVREEFLNLAEDLDLFHDANGTTVVNREDTKKFLEHLRNNSSTKQQDTTKKARSSITPRRRRSTIISTAATQEKKRLDGGVGGLGRGSNPLNSFFPFDPYLLRKSCGHVDPFYRNWEDCILTIEDDNQPKEAHEDEAIECSQDADNSDDVSDLEDDDNGDEDESDSNEEDGDDKEDDDDDDEEDDDESTTKPMKPAVMKRETEFRRPRAMSTGSNYSW